MSSSRGQTWHQALPRKTAIQIIEGHQRLQTTNVVKLSFRYNFSAAEFMSKVGWPQPKYTSKRKNPKAPACKT
jgi:hypothetical protein